MEDIMEDRNELIKELGELFLQMENWTPSDGNTDAMLMMLYKTAKELANKINEIDIKEKENLENLFSKADKVIEKFDEK